MQWSCVVCQDNHFVVKSNFYWDTGVCYLISVSLNLIYNVWKYLWQNYWKNFKILNLCIHLKTSNTSALQHIFTRFLVFSCCSSVVISLAHIDINRNSCHPVHGPCTYVLVQKNQKYFHVKYKYSCYVRMLIVVRTLVRHLTHVGLCLYGTKRRHETILLCWRELFSEYEGLLAQVRFHIGAGALSFAVWNPRRCLVTAPCFCSDVYLHTSCRCFFSLKLKILLLLIFMQCNQHKVEESHTMRAKSLHPRLIIQHSKPKMMDVNRQRDSLQKFLQQVDPSVYPNSL